MEIMTNKKKQGSEASKTVKVTYINYHLSSTSDLVLFFTYNIIVVKKNTREKKWLAAWVCPWGEWHGFKSGVLFEHNLHDLLTPLME